MAFKIILAEGKLYGFGRNNCGQLGFGSVEMRNEKEMAKPCRIKEALNGKRIVSVACGSAYTICISSKGIVYSMGLSSFYCYTNIRQKWTTWFGSCYKTANRTSFAT